MHANVTPWLHWTLPVSDSPIPTTTTTTTGWKGRVLQKTFMGQMLNGPTNNGVIPIEQLYIRSWDYPGGECLLGFVSVTMEVIKDPFGPALPVEVPLTQSLRSNCSFHLLSEITPSITTSVNFMIRSADGREVTAVMLCTLWRFHCAWMHEHSSFSVTGRKERKLRSAPSHPLLWEMKYGSLQ